MSAAHLIWLDQMRGAAVRKVALELGCVVDRRTLQRCPACGAERPVRRGGTRLVDHGSAGVGVTSDGRGWRCFACGEGGDAIDFVALSLCGRRLRDAGDFDRREIREWCQRHLGLASDAWQARPSRPSHPSCDASADELADDSTATSESTEPNYPPRKTIDALWKRLERVDEVPAVRDYLLRRGIDPTAVADLDIARAVPDRPRPPLPVLARYKGCAWWATGHRLIVPLVDAGGETRSVIARYIGSLPDFPKSLPPSGGHKRGGLVIACPLARQLLALGRLPEWWPSDRTLELVFAEGEIDWLAWATEWSDGAGEAPATIGVLAGAWRQAHADRIPADTVITIGTDDDQAGDHYVDQILETLADRDDLGPIRRWRAVRRAV